MEPINNDAPNQTISGPEITPIPSKNENLSVLIMASISLVVVVSIVLTFLARSQKTALVPTSSPSPTISPTLNSTENQVPDGNLTDWKTYANTKYAYQISVPSNWNTTAYADIPEQADQINLFQPKSMSIMISAG